MFFDPQGQQQIEHVDGVNYVFGSRELDDAIDRKIDRTHRTLREAGIPERIEAMTPGMRCDANATGFLARDLVYVSRDIQRVIYEKLRAAEFIPITTEVPFGAEGWTYRQSDRRGKALKSAHLAGDDAPNADVNMEEFPFPVTYAKGAYEYSLEEMAKTAFSVANGGVPFPLIREKAFACAEMIAESLDEMMRIGEPLTGITGFFNNPNVPVITLTNGEWNNSGTTPEQILADLAEIEDDVIDESRDIHTVSKLILPTAYEGVLRNKKVTDSERTIWQYFFGTPQQPGTARMLKELHRWVALNDAVGDDVGVDDPPQGIAYTPNPELVRAEIPVPYQELAPEVKGFGWKVNAFAVFGGVVFKRPLAARYIENLD